jgi:hypothetical protein
MLVGGVLAVRSHQSAGLTVGLFALGIGLIARTLYAPLRPIPARPFVIVGSLLFAWVLLESAFGHRPPKEVPLHKLKEDLEAANAWVAFLRDKKDDATKPNSIQFRKKLGLEPVKWTAKEERVLHEWEAEQESLRKQLTDRGQ